MGRGGIAIVLASIALVACDPVPPATSTSRVDSPTTGSDGIAFQDTTPRFSPDGREIVFVRETSGDSDLYMIELRSGDARPLVDLSEFDLDPAFSPDGSQVVFESSPNGFAQLHLVSSDGGEAAAISEVRDGWATFPAWSPDGGTIAYSCGRPSYEESDLCLISPEGESLGLPEGESSSRELESSWSPDGKTLAFASNRSGDSNVFLVDVRSGGVTQITSERSHDADPDWSPDGKTIAFTSDREGAPMVCLMAIDGSHVRCLTEGIQPSWSPDGEILAFYRGTQDGTRISVLEIDGSDVVQIT